MKIVNAILCLLFLLFAAVQYNDPDPWAWGSYYLLVAVVCGLAFFGRHYQWLTLAGIVITLVWLALLLPEFIHWIQMGMPTIVGSMKAEAPHIEFTREFLGLALSGAVLGWQYFRYRKVEKT